MTDARYTYTAGMPAARVGWLVARARSVAGITDGDLASAVGVPERTVRRWERGDLVPTDDEIEAIASACGTRITELLPRRTPVSYDRATGIMRMGDHAIAIPNSMHDNDAVLGAYIGMVRRQRGLRPDQDVRVRQEDLEALGEALDLDDGELEERLVRVIGLSRTQAAAVRAHLLRRRLAVPMVGLLAAFGLVTANRLFSTATEQVRTVGGGSVTRGNPYLVPTTTTTTPQPVVYLPTSAIPAPAASAPASAPADAGTLPAVVTAGPASPPPAAADVRTGPPRTSRTRTTTPPTDAATDPPSSDTPVTAPPATTASTTPAPTPAPPAASTPLVTPPPVTPPATIDTVVPTVPTGGVSGVTEAPPTTTTTIPAPTTTLPATTTTPPTTSITLGGGNSSTLSGEGAGSGSGTGTGSGSGSGSGGGAGSGTGST